MVYEYKHESKGRKFVGTLIENESCYEEVRLYYQDGTSSCIYSEIFSSVNLGNGDRQIYTEAMTLSAIHRWRAQHKMPY